MNDVITKSLYCSLLFCDRYAWLSKNKPEKYIEKKKEDILQNGKEVGDLARNLFGDYELIELEKNMNIYVKDESPEVKALCKRRIYFLIESNLNYWAF